MNEEAAPTSDINSNTIHIAIDIQNLYCKPGYRSNKDSTKAAKNAGKLIDLFRQNNIENIFIKHKVSENHGEEAEEFYHVEPKQDIVIEKKQRSAIIGTGLNELLHEKRIKNIFLSGVYADQCILNSIQHLISTNNNTHKIYVVKDCTANTSLSPKYINETFNSMSEMGVILTDRDEIEKCLNENSQGRYQPAPGI